MLSRVQTVTRDASPEAGAAANCRTNVRRTFEVLFDMAGSQDGLQGLSHAFSTCHPLAAGQGGDLALWIQVLAAPRACVCNAKPEP